ncbi:hypothetical protein MNBD_NITROSPINAE02-77 [hydrothermal vent metagenome]|uniref:Uncharacterized protein n=1 Tax=hydrothermal vent metagenome TaxID=652676 RepID=A0A3B1BD94_9ZZZZ
MNFFTSFAIIFTLLSQAPHLPPPPNSPADTGNEIKAEKQSEPIPLPENVFPKDDKKLDEAMVSTPVTERDIDIEASKKTVDYFIARPYLASRMMGELFGGPLELLKDDETGQWEATMKRGGFYTIKKLWSKKDKHIIVFEYFYRVTGAIGLKFSGEGAVILRTRKSDDSESAVMDYDIYVISGDLPLDKMAQALSMHRKWVRGDLMAVMESFTELCEAVAEEAEDVAEEMADEDEVFTKTEIDNFKIMFNVK